MLVGVNRDRLKSSASSVSNYDLDTHANLIPIIWNQLSKEHTFPPPRATQCLHSSLVLRSPSETPTSMTAKGSFPPSQSNPPSGSPEKCRKLITNGLDRINVVKGSLRPFPVVAIFSPLGTILFGRRICETIEFVSFICTKVEALA